MIKEKLEEKWKKKKKNRFSWCFKGVEPPIT